MGKVFGKLPSRILGIEDSLAAWQVDVAALNLGTWVENELEKRDKQGRSKRSLAELLAQGTTDGGRRTTKGRPPPRPESEFKSPVLMGMPIRKVKVNPDGTW